MSEFEFWDELGNIFNAIVVYQQKTIEFNKRYVSPWIRLGTILDKEDHNAESLQAHKRAIEIEQDNASNWLSLGDVYVRMGAFDDAANAYSQAIDLNPGLGWAYVNLATVNLARHRYTEAINMYIKSLEFIEDDKDRAMIWNRLGNAYRKVNDYENASLAFKMADECDDPIAVVDDQPDEVAAQPSVMPILAEVYINDKSATVPDETAADEQASDQTTELVDSEEPEIEPAKVADDLDIGSSPAEEAAAEPSVNEVSIEEESMTEDSASEAPSMELAEDQVLETAENESTADPAATDAQDTDLKEMEELIEMLAKVEPVEEPKATEVEQTGEQASTEITEVDRATAQEAAIVDAPADTISESQTEEADPKESVVETLVESPVTETVIDAGQPDVADVVAETHDDEIVIEPEQSEAEVVALESELIETAVSADTTITPMMSHEAGTFANPSALNQPVVLVIDDLADLISPTSPSEAPVAETPVSEPEPVALTQDEAGTATDAAVEAEIQPASDAVVEEVAESTDEEVDAQAEVQDAEPDSVPMDEETAAAAADPEVVLETAVESEFFQTESIEPVSVEEAQGVEVPEEIDAKSVESASDDLLKDTEESVTMNTVERVAENDPGTTFETSKVPDNLQLEPDTKNAHVWNELGNVYFSSGAYEEAVVAYSKAIELDDWFAWPYSNLALVYVQQQKYNEAILLYQRSIELFTSDNDKAITWNRLGNVYRRLNDYTNAIACYQRADELDPNNATRSLRSRFSLLGSLTMESATSLAV